MYSKGKDLWDLGSWRGKVPFLCSVQNLGGWLGRPMGLFVVLARPHIFTPRNAAKCAVWSSFQTCI
eukprot:6436664-Amphidinium_carterae.1